jgi:membrane fusion protein, multidrug efflux system
VSNAEFFLPTAAHLPRGDRTLRPVLVGAGLIALLILGALLVWLIQRHAAAGAAGAMPMATVVVSTPMERPLDERLGLLGQFAATNEVELRAQVGGTLIGIHFTDGAIVRKGDLLFSIDPNPYEIKLAQATSALEIAKGRLTLTETELKRAEELQREDAGSIQNVDQRTGDERNALASVHAAEAQIADARFDLDHCRITAPFTGRIGTHQVSVGNLIAGSRGLGNPTTLLATLVSLDPIYFNFDLSESDYQRFTHARQGEALHASSPVLLAIGNDTDYQRPGTLDFIDNQLDRSSGTLHARATVPNADQALTPGEFARVRIPLGAKEKQLLVPDAAVLPDQSQQVVLVVTSEGVVTPKPVKTGELRGGLRVITAGLSASDRVIVGGIPYAIPGSKVNVKDGAIDPALIRDLD